MTEKAVTFEGLFREMVREAVREEVKDIREGVKELIDGQWTPGESGGPGDGGLAWPRNSTPRFDDATEALIEIGGCTGTRPVV